MKPVLLVSLMALEEVAPLVKAELGVRNFDVEGGGGSAGRGSRRKDEGPDGLVELVDAVVGEHGRLGGGTGAVRGARVDLVL